MKKILLLPLISFTLLFTTACGNLKTTSHFDTPQTNIEKYRFLEIHTFETQEENVPKDVLTKIPLKMAEKVKEEKLGFSEVKYGEETSFPPSETLVLLGEIVNFESPSDVRYEGGKLKFGEFSLDISVVLLEKGTGKEIASGNISSFSSLGFLSSGAFSDKLYEQIAQEIVEFIRNNVRNSLTEERR